MAHWDKHADPASWRVTDVHAAGGPKDRAMTPEQAECELLVMSLEFMLPTTSEELLEILNRRGLREVEGGAPYDAEEYTGKPLSDLIDSTWKVSWLNGSTSAWTATNSESGDVITYLEGDVYARAYEEPGA